MLDQQYKKLQAEFHPDRFAGADDGKRLQALQQTSMVNDAYDTLKSPLKRAAYLLKSQGVNPDEHNQAHFGGEFLIRQMQLRESLDDLARQEDMDGLDKLKKEVMADRDEALATFENLYQEQQFVDAKPAYNRLQFLFKLLDEIDTAEEKLLDY